MKDNDHIFGDVSPSNFLQEYWQQKPLLIRNAFPDYSCPINADEMAGLACEPEVESRIILEHAGEYPWQCEHGPFKESRFSQLPETHWTLLVQSCNLHVTVFARLLEQFRFIPNWRVDDIMVSYAAPGGSVGPHVDNYDVFLLQAKGCRHWDISSQTFTETDFVADLDIRILKSFSAESSWKLEAGDMLYLPPGVAHHGVADSDLDGDDCITISIGFRAPNYTELTTALLDDVLSQHAINQNSSKTADFYQDPNIELQDNPGEISAQALLKINDMVQQELNRKLQDSDWFGKYLTSNAEINDVLPSDDELSDNTQSEMSPEQCLQPLAEGRQLVRNESSKLLFYISKYADASRIHFFCNGHVAYYSQEMLPIISLICNHRFPASSLLGDLQIDLHVQSFLANLIRQGHLYYERDVDDDEN